MTDLPNGWEWTTLGEIGDYVNGRAFKPSEWSPSGRPIIRIQNLTGSGSIFNYFDGNLEEKYVVRTGDFLISWAATLGSFVWNGPEGALNQHIFKVQSYIDPRFHRYLVERLIGELYEQTHGSGMVHVTRGKFAALAVALPPLAEQRRIVTALDGYLSHLEAADESLHLILRRAVSLSSSILARAVRGDLTERQESDVSAMNLLHQVAEERRGTGREGKPPLSPVRESMLAVPEHWVIASLDQLAHRVQYGTSAKTSAKKTATSLPVIRMGNIQNGHLTLDSLKYLPADHSDLHDRVLGNGDLLFNRTNSAELVGKSAVYRQRHMRATFASYLIRCQLVQGVAPEWVNLVINSRVGRRYVQSVASQQVGQANVSGAKLRQMPIPLPPTAEQLRIVQRVAEISNTIDRVSAQVTGALRQSQRLRRALLADAFSGQLVPQDPSDEPASVLLGWINAKRAVRPQARRARRTPRNSNHEQESML